MRVGLDLGAVDPHTFSLVEELAPACVPVEVSGVQAVSLESMQLLGNGDDVVVNVLDAYCCELFSARGRRW
jgi:hypothetical protein